jgi:hypothetical protein
MMPEIQPSHEHDPSTGRGRFSGKLTAEDMDGPEPTTERTEPSRTAFRSLGKHRKPEGKGK